MQDESEIKPTQRWQFHIKKQEQDSNLISKKSKRSAKESNPHLSAELMSTIIELASTVSKKLNKLNDKISQLKQKHEQELSLLYHINLTIQEDTSA